MVMRSARWGLESVVLILDRRLAARGESEMSIGVPSSVVRGFWIARAGRGSEAAASVRRAVN